MWGGFFGCLVSSLSASNQVIGMLWQHLCSMLGSFIHILHLDTVLPFSLLAYSGSRLLCQYWMLSYCPSFTGLLEYFEGYIIYIELKSQVDAVCTYWQVSKQ